MFVKVYKSVLAYELSGNSLKVYLFLCYCANILGAATVRYKTIQTKCGISSDTTISAALNELEEKGLVHVKNRFSVDRKRISNEFKICAQKGYWFKLPVSKDVFCLPKCEFSVLIYLLSKAGRKHRAFPSFNQIKSKMKLSKSTVSKGLKALARKNWIKKEKVYPGKHNLYTMLISIKSENKKRDCTHYHAIPKCEIFINGDFNPSNSYCTCFSSIMQPIGSIFAAKRAFGKRAVIFSHFSTCNPFVFMWNFIKVRIDFTRVATVYSCLVKRFKNFRAKALHSCTRKWFYRCSCWLDKDLRQTMNRSIQFFYSFFLCCSQFCHHIISLTLLYNKPCFLSIKGGTKNGEQYIDPPS